MEPFEHANASWLTESLATGGDLSLDPDLCAVQALELADAGITHMFDARIEASDADVWDEFEDIVYLNSGTDDREGHHIPAELCDQVVAFAREAEAAGGRLLVHCHMGVNRGPSLAAAVLLDRGMEPIQALQLVMERRPEAGVYYFVDAYRAHVKRVSRETGRKVPAKRVVVARAREILGDPALASHVMATIERFRDEDERAFGAMLRHRMGTPG